MPTQLDTPRLRGRRILVTGASRGIGGCIAELLAERGASVVALARHQTRLELCVAELAGDEHRAVALDVGNRDDWQAARAGGALDGIDGVVTAAAVLSPVGPLGTYSPVEFWHTMQVNVLGTLLAIEACLPGLEANRGAVVTLAGGGASSALPRYDAYATSKAAVVRLSENLAAVLGASGVRVNSVSPGFVATEMHAATLRAGPGLAGAGYFADTERRLEDGGDPARRAAELTAFLLDDAATGITGRLLSARWDPWKDAAFQQRLRDEPDLAKIRRIDDAFFAPTVNARG